MRIARIPFEACPIRPFVIQIEISNEKDKEELQKWLDEMHHYRGNWESGPTSFLKTLLRVLSATPKDAPYELDTKGEEVRAMYPPK